MHLYCVCPAESLPDAIILKENKMRNILLILILLTSVAVNAGNIVGRVVDEKDNSPLVQCTVKVYNAIDSAYITGTSTDENGDFNINGLRSGRYNVQFTFLGYAMRNRSARITPRHQTADVGVISMKEDGILLKETTVLGAKTEIVVKEDTVEYNADAYHTQPNAVVEDLLKKLPGVEVDNDGKITAHGKEVKKILVDGREFFADDPKVASKNFPVEMIEKLQIVDRSSDLARLTGVDDGEDETVINLSLKKGMNDGWFGNVEGGYGTDDRYMVNGIVNHFRNGNQFTVIANANNTNNTGYTDMGGKSFRRYGGSNGINASQSVGINFNIGKGETFRIGGDVMYSHNNKDVISKLDREYIFPDSTSYFNKNGYSRDKGHDIRGEFRLKWEIDEYNTLEFRPSFMVNANNSFSQDSSLTKAGDIDRTLVTKSRNVANSDGTSIQAGGDLRFNHKFASKPGRSFSIRLKYNFGNVQEDESAFSRNLYYLLVDEEETNQIIDNHRWNNSVNGRVTWLEPLGDIERGNFVEASYQTTYRWTDADKLVYDRNFTSAEVTRRNMQLLSEAGYYDAAMLFSDMTPYETSYSDILNEELSNRFRNDFFEQELRVGYKKKHNMYSLNAGMAFLPTMSKSENLITDAKNIPERWVWNIAPYLRFKYKFSKTRSLRLNYRGRSSQPTMAQLQPVADTSNPQHVVIGNPNLKSEFTHMLRFRFQDFNREKQRSIMAIVNAQYTQNSIISATKYNSETGGQTTTYRNVNGVWNVMAMNMVSLPFKNKHWQFSNHLFARFSVSKGYINGDFNRNNSFNMSEMPMLTYRNDFLEVRVSPRYSLQTSVNTVESSIPVVHTYGGRASVSCNLPFGLNIGTDLNYSDRSGYSEGFNVESWLWNATVSYQFLKNRAATIAVKAYDLLQQRKNLQRSITAGYIQDQEYNNLTRYFMVTFSYKFNSFGSGKPEGFKESKYGRGYGGGHRRF